MKTRTLTILFGFIIPFSAIIFCFPFYNRIEPYIFGFSFNYFWIFSWLFITALCLFIAYKLDTFNREDARAMQEKKLAKVKELMDAEADGTFEEVKK